MGDSVKSQTESSPRTTVANSKIALLFGFGYTAKALLPALKAKGYKVIGTVRNSEKAAELSALTGAHILPFSGPPSQDLLDYIRRADIIISSVPPADNGSDPVLSAIPDFARRAVNCDWAAYLSATSVYGDRKGQWAFEDEMLYPVTQRGKNRITTELTWLETGLPLHVFRLAGIYGPEIFGQSRNAFRRLTHGNVKAVIKPGHVVNRIHVEDISSALMASMDRPNPCQVYNIADGSPAAPQDVLDFAADLIQSTRPPKQDWETAEISPMARSFYMETKRIDISRAQNELGWAPRFKTYRDGLAHIYRHQYFDGDAFLLAGHIIVPDADLEAIYRELPNHKDATLVEPGCLRFDVFPDLKAPNKFHVFEVFKSEQAFRLHKNRMKGTDWVKASANVERFYTVSKAD